MKLSAPIDLNTALSNASSKVDAAIANTNSSIANYNKTVPESMQQFIPDLTPTEETQQNALYTDADLRRMGTLGNVANFGAQVGTSIAGIAPGVAQLYHEVAGNIAAKRLDPLDQVALQAKLYGSDHATFAKNYQASLQAQIDDLTQSTDIDPAYKAAQLPVLQAKLAAGAPTLNDYLHAQSADGSFGYDRIASAQDQYQSAQDSATLKKDITGLANHAGQLERSKKLDEYQSLNNTGEANARGFGKYALGYLGQVTKETLNSPAALSDDIAGSAAYMLGGAQRVVATKALGAFSQTALVADGFNTLGEGIQATRLNNKERSISGAEAVTSVLGSAAYYALNKIGSDNTAKAIVGVSPTLNAASLESRNILTDALAKAGKVPGVTGATHLGQTALIEGSTEGAQTYFQDNVAKNNFSDVNLENILQATGVGAVMGGALSTPAAVGNAFTLSKDKVKATQAQIDGSIEDNIDINNAAAYNPNMAVGKIAQQTVGIEDQDILAAHFADAQAVEAKANEHLIDAQDQFKQLNVGLPERIAELQDTIDQNTALLDQVPVELVPQVQASIDQAQTEIDQLSSPKGEKIHTANIKAAQSKLDTIEQMVKDTSAQVATFGRNIQSKADRAAAQQDQVNADGTTTDAVKAPVDLVETKKQIFTNPNSMAHDDIQSFIDNPDAPIDDNERNALREFSAARQALQARQNTSSVSQAVLKGADGFKGLNDYQSGISAAINSGNKKLAAQLTAQLTKFAASQNKKAALARELYDAAVKKGTREKTRMVYTLQGDWVKDTGQFKNISRDTNGALDIHKGSLNLIQAIEFDSENINKAAAAFTTITKDAVADPSTAVPVKVQQAQVAQTKLATNRQINTSKQVLPYEANSTYNAIRGVTVADPKAPSDRNIADVSTAVLGQALPKQQDFQFTPNESGDAAKFANTEMTLASYANKMISNSQVTSDSRGTTVVDKLKEHFGDQTNSNDFTSDDVVYVTEPYNTKVTPETLSQVSAAIEAGATILMPPTFTQYGLSRSKRLNTQLKALRDISQVLREGGYSDYAGIGVWVKDSSKQATTATPKPAATQAPVAPQPAPVTKPAAPVQAKAEPKVEVKPARTIQDEQAAETKAEPVVEAKPVTEMTDQEIQTELDASSAANTDGNEDLITERDIALYNEQQVRDNVVESVTTVAEDKPTPVEQPTEVVAEDAPIAKPNIVPISEQEFEDIQDSLTKLANKPLSVKAEGRLDVLNNTEEEVTAEKAKDWVDQNLVTTGMNQQGEVKGKGNPLLAVPNLLRKLSGKSAQEIAITLQPYLHEELTMAQINLIQKFIAFAVPFNARLSKMVKADNPKFYHRNFVKFLLSPKTKQLDENTLTAASLAVFNWVNDNRGTGIKNEQVLRDLLGIPEDMPLPASAYAYARIGDLSATIATALGTKITTALALQMNPDAPADRMTKLQQSIGTLALDALKAGALVEVTQMSRLDQLGVMAAAMSEEAFRKFELQMIAEATNGEVTQTLDELDETQRAAVEKKLGFSTVQYVRVARTSDKPDSKPVPYAKGIIDAFKDTKGILGDLFGMDSLHTTPRLKPAKFTQTKIKGTEQRVPSALRKRIEKSNKTPMTLRADIVSVLRELYYNNPEGLKALLQIKDEDYLNTLSITKRKGLEAKWAAQLEGVKDALDYIDTLEKDKDGNYPDLFLEQVVYINQRIGYASTALNPQTNKVHRGMLGLKSAIATITPTKGGYNADHLIRAVGNPKGKLTLEDKFMMSIAAGMEGIKVLVPGYESVTKQTVDKIDPRDFLPEFAKQINAPYMREYTSAMTALMEGKATPADIALVAEAVDKFDSDELGMSALMQLAIYHKGEQFTSSLGLDSDGTTNGMIIANLANGTLTDKMANQGGLFTEISGFTNFFQTKKEGLEDYYETIATVMNKSFHQLMTLGSNEFFDAVHTSIMNIELKLFTRSFAKTLATPFNYGAGIAKIKAAIATAVLGKVYDKFEKIAKQYRAGDKQAAVDQIQALEDEINTLIVTHNVMGHNTDFIDYVKQLHTYDGKLDEGEYERALWGALVARTNATIKPNVFGAIDIGKFDIQNQGHQKGLLLDMVKKLDMEIDPKNDIHTKKGFNNIMYQVIYKTGTRHFKEVKGITLPTNPEELLNYTLSFREQSAFLSAVGKTLGTTAGFAIAEEAAAYIKARDINAASQEAAFVMHDILLKNATNDLIQREVAAGNIPTDKDGNPLEGLSKLQQNEINKQVEDKLAIIPTAASTSPESEPEDKLTGGLRSVKQDTIYTKTPGNTQRLVFARPNGQGNTDSTVGIARKIETSPGVSTSAQQVQAIDSNISSTVGATVKSINLHDANQFAFADFELGTKEQNRAFFYSMMQYSLPVSIAQAMYAPLVGIVKGFIASNVDEDNRNGLPDDYVTTEETDRISVSSDELNKSLESMRSLMQKVLQSGEATFAQLDSYVQYAYQAELSKLRTMRDFTSIHQYAGADGEWSVDQETYDALDAQIKKVEAEYTAAVVQWDATLTAINIAIEKSYVEDDTAKQAQAEQSIELDYAVRTEHQAQWNTPVITPVISEGDALRNSLLSSTISAINANKNPVLFKLFTALGGSNLTVKFTEDSSLPKDVYARYDTASHTILLNPAYKAKWTPQLIMHELVHAATSQALNIGEKGKLTSAIARQGYEDIVAIYNFIKTHPDFTGSTAYGLVDVHEFLAEAFTNPDFQKALSNVRVKLRSTDHVTSAWNGFKEAVAKLFNVPSKSSSMTVIEALVSAATQLQTEKNTQSTIDNIAAQFVNPNMVAHVNGLSASELLDQVSSQSVSDSFMAHLRSVFSETVEPLQEAIGLQTLLADSSTQPNDVLMQRTIESGKAPYVSSMRDAGFLLSSEEAYAVESIEAAAFAALEAKSDTLAFKELFKTFEAAKEHLEAFDFHYGDWNQANDQERRIAEAKYDLVFGASDNHYLSRFIALTLGSEEINKKLSIIPQAKESTEEADVFKKFLDAFSSVVDRFTGSIVGVRTSDVVAERVNTLLEQLSSIELRKRSDLQDKIMQGITDATNLGDSVLGTRSLIARAAEKATDNVLLQAILAPAKLDTIGKSVKQLRDYNNPNQPLGIVAEAFREGSTSDKVQRRFELFARAATVMQRTRKEIIATTKKGLLNTFSEKGKYLEKRHHEAISYGLLRTDVQSIMDHYGIDRIKALYSNNAFRNKEIQDLERTILKNKNGNEFIHRTRDLAYNMIKQDTRIAQAKNAQQIASRVTVVKNPTIIPNDAQIVRDIDRLATLYAISEVKPEQRKLIVEMMTKEAKTGAIKYVINSHGVITADARVKLFSGNPLNMAKGYVPEITNPHKEFKVGANTPENIADMKLRGFNLHSTVKPHPQDPVEAEWAIFISPDGGQQRFVTGQMSLSTTHRKGTQAVGQADPKELSRVDNYTRSRALNTYKGDALKYDPAAAERGMVPAIDTQGNVIAYGYEMQAATRDALLERNNDFSDILGQYAGQIQDRMDSPKHNNEIMKALHEDFTDNYARNPHAYVDIGTRSNHPRLREIWAMLPQDTRFHAEGLFGKGKPIYVRNDLITPVFGFNKISIGTMFDKHSGDRNLTEAITVAGFQMIFKDDARLSAIRTQRGVMEAIGLLKDLLVIRNVTTMINNLKANAVILSAFGINPIDMVKGIKTAIQGALLYTKYNALLLDAQQRLLAGDGDAKTHQENIIKYSDILDRNPVKDFIDAGMFSTIVEDIGAEDNHYTYLSAQQRKMKKFTDKVPNSIKTTFNWVTVSPETPMHKFLTNATSFSDFAAKYVLYTHLTTKAKVKKTPAEAMDIASDMFINYDIPTSRELQFMNDIGILMFTKYNIRIQKALVYLIRNHAGNVLVQGAVLGMLANLPSAMESFMPFHIGNPFKPSILALPGALDEPLPIKLLGSLFWA